MCSRKLCAAALACLSAVAGCAGFTLETSSSRPSEPPGGVPVASAEPAAIPPAKVEGDAGDTSQDKSDFIGFQRDQRIERLEKQRMRFITDLFADASLAKELAAVPDEEKAPAIDAVRAAIEAAAKRDAEDHVGWSKTTVAPKAAADAAMTALRADRGFRDAAMDVELLRVQVIDPDWKIEKNKGGYPLAKFKFVRIVAKRQGVDACIAFYGSINHSHEGGGRYAQAYGSVPNSQWSGVKCPAGVK
jgi:hypothetical protein